VGQAEQRRSPTTSARNNTGSFQQDLGSAGKGDSAGTVAANRVGLNMTSTTILPSFNVECSTTSDPLPAFSAPHNEQEQNELLAMVYPMAGSFPFEPESDTPSLPISADLPSESLYAPYYGTTQFSQDLDHENILSSFR
jgi:hypothetical protein